MSNESFSEEWPVNCKFGHVSVSFIQIPCSQFRFEQAVQYGQECLGSRNDLFSTITMTQILGNETTRMTVTRSIVVACSSVNESYVRCNRCSTKRSAFEL